MGGEIDEMDRPKDEQPSQNGSFIRTQDKSVPYSYHASRLDAEHANDCVGSSSTGQWTEDNELTYTLQGQHGNLESYSRQHSLRAAANNRVEAVREHMNSGPNPPWCQEETLTHQQLPYFYPRQRLQPGAGTPSYHQYKNSSTRDFILDPPMAAKNEPCSTFDVIDGSQMTHRKTRTQVVGGQNASDTTYSLCLHDDPDPLYPNHNRLETYMSKVSPQCRLYPSQPSAPMFRIESITSSHPNSFESLLRRIHAPSSRFNPQCRSQNHAERASSLSRTGRNCDNHLPHQGRHLAPLMQRCVSSPSSQTTEATSSSAVSDHTTEVVKCLYCVSTFSGNFRNGNRTRHMKAKHSKRPPIECRPCGKIFGRSDALQKHIRKQHS